MTTHTRPEPLAHVAPLSQALHRLDEAHRRFRFHVARSLALSPTELTALLVIADIPGISPGALADDLGFTSGSATALIDRLEDAGHVQRHAGRTDRRRLEIHLTIAGQDTLGKMRNAYRTVLVEADTNADLTATLSQIDGISSALNEAAKNRFPAIG